MHNLNTAVIAAPDDTASPEELRAHAGFYQLLAGAFVEEPTQGYLAALRSPDSLAALAELGLAFDSDFIDTELAELQDNLACEYASLFTTAGGCPPVESSRLTGRFQQEPYHQVKAAYHACGYTLGKSRFSLFEDQLGVELGFLATLLERQAQALEDRDSADALRLEKHIKRFWALHPGRWVRGYASLLERATDHSFYREIARMLHGFAEQELERLGVRVDDLDGGREKVPKSEISLEFNPDEPVCNGCSHGQV